jgi:hypothetical protein
LLEHLKGPTARTTTFLAPILIKLNWLKYHFLRASSVLSDISPSNPIIVLEFPRETEYLVSKMIFMEIGLHGYTGLEIYICILKNQESVTSQFNLKT